MINLTISYSYTRLTNPAWVFHEAHPPFLPPRQHATDSLTYSIRETWFLRRPSIRNNERFKTCSKSKASSSYTRPSTFHSTPPQANTLNDWSTSQARENSSSPSAISDNTSSSSNSRARGSKNSDTSFQRNIYISWMLNRPRQKPRRVLGRYRASRSFVSFQTSSRNQNGSKIRRSCHIQRKGQMWSVRKMIWSPKSFRSILPGVN